MRITLGVAVVVVVSFFLVLLLNRKRRDHLRWFNAAGARYIERRNAAAWLKRAPRVAANASTDIDGVYRRFEKQGCFFSWSTLAEKPCIMGSGSSVRQMSKSGRNGRTALGSKDTRLRIVAKVVATTCYVILADGHERFSFLGS